MATEQLNGAGGADPLSRLVSSQAGAKSAPAPNLPELISQELNPQPAEAFNPQLHEADEGGRPIFNADGTLRRKRGRRPGQTYTRPGGDGLDDGGESIAPAPISPAAARAEAELCTAITFSTCEGLFGPAWEPEPAERDQVNEALAAYIEQMGGLGIPPWATVVLAFGSYAAKRTPIGRMVGMTPPAAIAAAPEGEPPSIDLSQFTTAEMSGPPAHLATTAPVQRGTGGGMKPPPVARESE